MAVRASLVPLNNGSGEIAPGHRCRKHCLSSPFSLHCAVGSLVLAISSSIAFPSSPGAVLTPMPPLAMLPLSILVRSYAAIASIHSSVVARAYHSFFSCLPKVLHDAPFAQPLLAWAVHLYRIRPRVIRLDAAYWGLHLIAWIHGILGAVAVIPL